MAYGSGAADALQELLQQAFLRQQAEQQMKLQQQAGDRAQQQLMLQAENQRADQEYRTGQVARQAQQDDVAAADRRQKTNQQGVQRMMGEFLMQRGSTPLDQGARNQLMGMGLSEGIDVPSTITTDPGQRQREAIELENLRNQHELQQIGAAAAESRRTAAAKTQPTPTQSPYAAERNTRTLQSVDELIGKVGNWTAGAGSVLSKVPGTPARDFTAELDTLKANIAFNELTEMREASKTGGALGSVAVRELALLESTLGALDQGQSPENLKAQLQKVKDNILRWQAAKAGAAPMASHGASAAPQTPAAAPPPSDVVKWVRGPDGRPMRAR